VSEQRYKAVLAVIGDGRTADELKYRGVDRSSPSRPRRKVLNRAIPISRNRVMHSTQPESMAVTVLNSGPIRHADIERYDDPDIETGLEHSGFDVTTVAYRLVEIDLGDMEDTRWFPGHLRPNLEMVRALRLGELLPPVVVVRPADAKSFGLIDGLNRTFAHWVVGLPRIRAYEVTAGLATNAGSRS
jgi:hypothetical protein